MVLRHFYARKTLQIHVHVNLCNTVQLLEGFPPCNGGKLEEAEDFKCIFVVYCVTLCVRIEIDQLDLFLK